MFKWSLILQAFQVTEEKTVGGEGEKLPREYYKRDER